MPEQPDLQLQAQFKYAMADFPLNYPVKDRHYGEQLVDILCRRLQLGERVPNGRQKLQFRCGLLQQPMRDWDVLRIWLPWQLYWQQRLLPRTLLRQRLQLLSEPGVQECLHQVQAGRSKLFQRWRMLNPTALLQFSLRSCLSKSLLLGDQWNSLRWEIVLVRSHKLKAEMRLDLCHKVQRSADKSSIQMLPRHRTQMPEGRQIRKWYLLQRRHFDVWVRLPARLLLVHQLHSRE